MGYEKLKLVLSILRFLPWTIYFNFHYLSFLQACRLPIVLYKPKLCKCKGSIELRCDKINTGMIRLGFLSVSLYPNNGIMWENNGGKIVFEGSCLIGNNSFISVGTTGNVSFGDRFQATCAFRLSSYNSIIFKENTLIGWENTIIDTDFHKLSKVDGGYTHATSPIMIGKNSWLGLKCIILKGTIVGDNCVVGAASILNKQYDNEYVLISGNPGRIVKHGVYRDPNDDMVKY